MLLSYTATQVSVLNKQATQLYAACEVHAAIALLYQVAELQDAREGGFAFGIESYLRLAKWLQAEGRLPDALAYTSGLRANLRSRNESNFSLENDDVSYGGIKVTDIRALKLKLIAQSIKRESLALTALDVDLHRREEKRLKKLSS